MINETETDNPIELQESQNSSQETDSNLTKSQKQKILTILFSRLLQMHKKIMTIFTLVHSFIIFFVCIHMFTLGTIESENTACYLTWPLTHLYYAFINYLFAWFFCYNSCEIMNKKGHHVLIVSKKFLKVLFFFSVTPILLKLLCSKFCRNWNVSWHGVLVQTFHILLECVLVFIYFTWFERKYTGFKIFYKESIF